MKKNVIILCIMIGAIIIIICYLILSNNEKNNIKNEVLNNTYDNNVIGITNIIKPSVDPSEKINTESEIYFINSY